MKTRILSFLILALGLMVSTSAFAQPQTVESSNIKAISAKDGSTITYSVTGPTTTTGTNTYKWALSGGSNTNVSSITTNSVEITWDNATPTNTYNLDVYVIDEKGCFSELYRYEVTIQSITLSIADATTETCSWLLSEATAGRTGNSPSQSDNDIIEFEMTLDDSNGAANPIAVTYTVYDGTNTETRNENVTFSGTTGTLNIQIDDFFANTSGNAKTYTITLISAVDHNSNDLTIHTTNKTATINVHSVPTISFVNN